MLHGGAIKISHRLKVSSVLLPRAETKLVAARRRRARATSWDSEYHEEAGTAEPMGVGSPAREISKSDKKLLEHDGIVQANEADERPHQQ